MKAFVYNGDKKLSIEDRPIPKIQKNEALMKVSVASICGTDLRTFRFGNSGIPANRITGHEAGGELVELGGDIKGFSLGDTVTVAPAVGCGECPSCRRGKTNMCDNLKTIGFEYDGIFAESLKIPSQAFIMGNVIKLDNNFPLKEATLAEPVACCINGQSFLKPDREDTVLIFGAGFIGCIHAELALMSGSKRVIIADVSGPRLDIAKKLIPEIGTINVSDTDIKGAITEETGGRGADVIITANPDGRTHTEAGSLAAKNGRISLFGGIPGESRGFLDSNMIHYKELSLFGSHATTPEHIKTVLAMVKSGKLDLSKYISGAYPLNNITDAFERLKKADVMKLLIQP